MADRIPRLTLAQAPNINPAVIQMADYTPRQEDFRLLADSLARAEEREYKANEQISAMDVKFGEMRSKLHQDAETLNWFDNWSKGLKDQVQQAARIGDYSGAINTAVKLAGEAAKNGELLDRIRTNAQYQEIDKAQKARINDDISQETYNWWKQNNPYEFKPIVDGFGNVTGGEEINVSVPYKDINFAGLYEAAFKLISPDKNEVSRSSRRDSSTSDESGSRGGGSASSSAQSYVRVKKEKILENVQKLIEMLPGGISQVEQSYDVYKYKTQELQNKLDLLQNDIISLLDSNGNVLDQTAYDNKNKEIKDLQQKIYKREELMSSNGGPISYEEYYARMLCDELLANGLAYDWRSDSRSSASSNHSSTNSRYSDDTSDDRYSNLGTGGYSPNNGRSGVREEASAPSVRKTQQIDYTTGINNAESSTKSLFENAGKNKRRK